MFFVDEGLQKVLRSLGFWIREKLLRSGIFNDLSVIQKQDPVRDCPGKLESAYILHRCARYDIKGKELLKTQEKFYLADPALRYSVLGYNADSAAAMLENIVYLELLRRAMRCASVSWMAMKLTSSPPSKTRRSTFRWLSRSAAKP